MKNRSELNKIHDVYECAPSVFAFMDNIYSGNNEKRFASCYRTNDLKIMIKEYNKSYPDDKIELHNNKTELWNGLNDKLRSKCKDEACWIEQDFVKKIPSNKREFIEEYTFKPPRPLDEHGGYKGVWLSDIDIRNVMKQYEYIYDDFKFLGPYPIDWAQITFYNFTPDMIEKYAKKGYKRIGIIFNTGTLQSGGRHWVAVFIDFKHKTYNDKYTVEYFDSVGKNPPSEIKDTIEQIYGDCCPSSNKCNCVKVHKHIKQLPHQVGNSECGVYCLYFITERLRGRTYIDIQSQLTRDDVMETYRSKFFRWIYS